MTYRSRGRSIFEVILAVCFVAFLVGFITVLCIGNYFRAKRAQERQRQRRLAKLASAGAGNPAPASVRGGSSIGTASPRSAFSGGGDGASQTGYEAPHHLPSGMGGGVAA
uniref:Transmembrane protein n=1 Tax=Helicotheca tamesis TaxID=374047 RepID=A0A6U0GP15_9STRA|mmetsp:Transcript_2140/g.3016  ORF Transcript_2140/g.3016 Transcript_2140/m.3016 type:complete len:110 (+) Transcript_2140:97-426(+)|eukprot:CAMPEP_0185730840 /NCGR_PEP_ID=MMETSP1171-20130828/11140_1 /TAXON_ID=374046 /ORGANISM="Helicotheca tamensis, Strain CCMP826" /LENGTH=109 /DNA_ID=CAMNT_0028399975 /DNA_START=53 /DNA_END=382 /DNA_ORIENTATION=+